MCPTEKTFSLSTFEPGVVDFCVETEKKTLTDLNKPKSNPVEDISNIEPTIESQKKLLLHLIVKLGYE